MTDLRSDPLVRSAVTRIPLLRDDGRPCLLGLRDRALVVTAIATGASPSALADLRAGAITFTEHGVLIDLTGVQDASVGGAATVSPGGPLRTYETLRAWDEALPSVTAPLFPALCQAGLPTEVPLGSAVVRGILEKRLGPTLSALLLSGRANVSFVQQVAAERAAWRAAA